MKRHIKKIWIPLLLLASCLERYVPPDVKVNLGALVVDGFINTTDASATISLSRSTSLSNTQASTPEINAIISLEEFGSNAFVIIPPLANGLYKRSGLSLGASKKYRLHVRTSQAKNYFSDYIDMKPTPPIDSVFWEPEKEKEGIQVYVATHDPSRNAAYYQWDFVETYQHDAYFESSYIIQDGKAVNRPNGTGIHRCWTTENSTKISVATSKNLSEDVIRYPLTFIPKESLKISAIHGFYSILVLQNTLDESAFNFWQQLQKSTENLGGLFDPQPSQITGNVHGSGNSASEVVLGYFSAGAVTQKRIFIDPALIPDYAKAIQYGPCPIIDLEGPGTLPLSDLPNGFPLISSGPATTSTGDCIDCRKDGGTTTKPSFWP